MKTATKLIALFSIALLANLTYAEHITEYKGYIGLSPIHLILSTENDESIAIYSYAKYDTPISLIGGIYQNRLILDEIDNPDKKPNEFLSFPDFTPNQATLIGTWKSRINGNTYPIKLTPVFDYHNSKYTQKPLLIADSNKHHYFKLIVSNDGTGIETNEIAIYKKGTDKLIQKVPYDWDFSLWAVSTDDYNFDGYEDFSYLQGSSMGNTWSNYYLWNPNTKQYSESNISGSSLTFDQENKLIYSENRSGMSRYATYITYKLDNNNEMIQLSKKCTELNVNSASNEYYEMEIACDE